MSPSPAEGTHPPDSPLEFDLVVIHATAVLGGVDGEQYRIAEDHALGIAGGEFQWIGPTADLPPHQAERTIDAAGKVAFPGLTNTHNHLFQNLVKGLGDEMALLPWVEIIILPTAEKMTPDETYLASMVGCLEAIRSGTTTLLDFMFGLPDIEQHRAVLRAFRDSGLRGFLGRATRELNPDSGFRDPWYLPLPEVFDQMRQLAREFPSGHSVPSVLPAPGTVRTMTADGLVAVKEYALAEGSQITIHIGEYAEERQLSIDRWGRGAFAVAEDIGFLGPEVVAVHCVQVNHEEREIIARTGTQVSYNPVSNSYLGSGVAPVIEMLDLGIDVSLATDGGACGNTQDMLEALRYGSVVQKGAARNAQVINARDLLQLATVGGARAVGLPNALGAISVGRRADLFLFDPYRLKTVPMHDPISTLVYAGDQSNVHTVVVDGRIVLDDGRFTQVDEDALVREMQERAAVVARRVGTSHLVEGRRMSAFGIHRHHRR